MRVCCAKRGFFVSGFKFRVTGCGFLEHGLEKFLDGMVNFWHADGTDLLEQSADLADF